jgi:hypothetical protein
MLPFGLQFQTYKQPKKLPMRLEQSPVEAFKKHIYKIANVEYPKDNRKKNKTIKTAKAKKS